ncbi:response regulator [Planctobacterium marinum]|uniref:Response regulatory domain-containing protein n=1 Tax=Planctobacterium marinum TaxID=1631968 RepID=A0AA48HGR8_9ALTE|nr:hypothetical protein MACH26_05550 [Planctobacterium marinum]
MTDKNATVLVVDDSAADLQITMSAISGQFKVLAAKNGEQAIAMMDKIKADIVLLDVNMPGLDGYQTCEQLITKNEEVDIIFVSSNDSTEEIMKGYELGGSDYIVKPIMPEVLLSKVSKLIASKSQKKALKDEASNASMVAMTAMSSSGELSVVLEFLRNSFKSKSEAELASLIINSLHGYSIQASFEIRILEEVHHYSTAGEVSPVEKALLGRIADMPERLSEHGQRLFINNGLVSFIIKNMPVQDDERAGRLRDYLAILSEGATEKVETMAQLAKAAEQRSESMTAIIEEANEALAYIHQTQQDIEKQNVALLDDLVQGVEESFVGLGLTDEQENSILNLLNDAQEKSTTLFHQNAQLENALENIVAKFKQLVD